MKPTFVVMCVLIGFAISEVVKNMAETDAQPSRTIVLGAR